MALAGIKKGKKGSLKERLIILGEKGIGKTTFGADAPKPIFIPTEDGCSSIEGLDYFPKQTTYKGILECINNLGKEDHAYETLVIDTLDGVTDLLGAELIKDEFSNNANKFNSFGAGDKRTAQKVKELMDLLDKLREAKNMRIIMLTHPGTMNVRNPEGDDYVKIIGSMGKWTWGALSNWADRIGYAGFDFIVRHSDEDGKRGKAKQRGDDRFVRFLGTPTVDAKCRVGYEMKEDKILFTYAAYKENA